MSQFLSMIRNHWHFCVIVPLLIVLVTFPTILYVFDTNTFWLPSNNLDIWMNFWDVWHGKQVLTGQAEFYYTNTLFYPNGLSLSFHTFSIPHMLIFGLLQAILPLSNAYNLTYLLIIFSCTLSAYIYIYYLFKDKWVSFLGAIIFGFSIFIVRTSFHPEINIVATLPLSLYFLHRAIREKRTLWFIISGALIGITAFIGLYLFICLMITLGMYLLYFVFSEWRDPKFWLRVVLLFVVIGATSSIRIYPMISNSQGLSSALEKNSDSEENSDLLDYFIHYKHPLLSTALDDIKTGINQSVRSYLGFISLALIAIGLSKPTIRRKMIPWICLLLTFFILRLGSYLTINDITYENIRLPKFYLDRLLPSVFEPFHSTDNFQVGIILPLAILSCYGLIVILKYIQPKYQSRFVLLVIVLIIFELYQPPRPLVFDNEQIAYLDWLQQEDNDTISLINLPMGRSASKLYDFYQSISDYPHVEGLAARTPPEAYSYIQDNFLLVRWNRRDSIGCIAETKSRYLSALDQLESDGFTHIVLHYYIRDHAPKVIDSFSSINVSYQDKFVGIHRLQDLRDTCPP